MSVKIMGAVWDADLPRREKYVLLSYADHAAHDGSSVYPSVGRTAWKTGYSDRSIHKITAELVKKGILIEVKRRGHGVKEYRIDVTKLPTRGPYNRTPEESSEVQKDEEPTPEESSHQPPKNLRTTPEESSHKPSCNHHDEPSSTPKGAQAPETPPLPRSYQGWIDYVREATNKQAAIRTMVAALYEHYEEDELPAYGYIGTVANRVGGYPYLAELVWKAAPHTPQGKLMSYIQKIHKGRRHGSKPSREQEAREPTEKERQRQRARKARTEWRAKQIAKAQEQWRQEAEAEGMDT